MCDWIQETREAIAAAKRVWNADPAACDGEDSKQHERNQHRSRALVDAVSMRVPVRVLPIGRVLRSKEFVVQCDRQRDVIRGLPLQP